MRQLELVLQPRDSKLCGQACIAMVAGVSLDEAVKVVGHTQATRTQDLIKALAHFGIHSDRKLSVAPRAKRFTKNWCSAIISIQRVVNYKGCEPKFSHWIVNDHGKLLDPSGANSLEYGRVISALGIRGKLI